MFPSTNAWHLNRNALVRALPFNPHRDKDSLFVFTVPIYTPAELIALAQSPLVKQHSAATHAVLHEQEELAGIALSRRQQRTREYLLRNNISSTAELTKNMVIVVAPAPLNVIEMLPPLPVPVPVAEILLLAFPVMDPATILIALPLFNALGSVEAEPLIVPLAFSTTVLFMVNTAVPVLMPIMPPLPPEAPLPAVTEIGLMLSD